MSMIEKFNNVWYLIIFLVHFLGFGILQTTTFPCFLQRAFD